MKILTIHANFIEFQPTKKALKEADNVPEEKEKVSECLVVFSAVEKRDEENISATAKRYVEEIKNIASQVKTKTIVLYPYAHLSSQLASPKKAEQVLKEAEEILVKEKYHVTRAPFGWYKSFTLSCKGHPLSELSREFTAEEKAGKIKEEESEAVKAEQKLVSQWHILDTNGKLHEIKYDKENKKFSGFDFKKYPQLQKLSAYEMAKDRVAHQEPAHVSLMRKLELVDYEPGSDPGNLRFYPKGRFIKGLIETLVTQKVKAYGGMEIETPIMYDYEHPSLKSYLQRFPARQYTIQTPNKKVFLRFAACFGQFLQAHDALISYKQLPVRLYELTRYSFRVEQHGELSGLRRLRAFTMPDCHALCANMDQAKQELLRRFQLGREVQEAIGFSLPDDFEFAIRITNDFWKEHQNLLQKLVKEWGKPALIEMWEQRIFYFVMKYEWNFIDSIDKAAALNTDQIDIENAERYGVVYTDEKSQKQHPLILHLSPSGAVERVIYALLEKAARVEKEGKVPCFPLWLAPTQVRLIPVSIERHLDFAQGVAEEFAKLQIRADVDDRVESVGKRIRASGQEWVPYTLVIGDEEIKDTFKRLMIRDREKKSEEKMRFDELVNLIKKKTKGLPYDTLPLPVLLSKRISFVG